MLRTVLLCLTFAAVPASADGRVFENLEHAAEVTKLQLSTDKRQLVYAKRCDHCPTLALSLNSSTLVFDGRQPISLTEAAAMEGRGGTLFFDPQTREILRVVYWPKSES